MATSKTYNSVLEMTRDIADDASFADELEDHLESRKIARDLAVSRASQGLTQTDIARRLGCSQGRISKLENSADVDLKLGELAMYASALGLRISVTAERMDRGAVDRVKHHAFRIKEELDRLAELAGNDHGMAAGVSGFLGEAFFNLVTILQASARKLPSKPDDGKPYISFDIDDIQSNDADDSPPAENQPVPDAARDHLAPT